MNSAKTPRISAMPPHNGAVTHHHDQSITSVNFSTKNVIKRSPQKLTPPFVVFELITLIL